MNNVIQSIVLAAVLALSGWSWFSVVSRLEVAEANVGVHGQKIVRVETEVSSLKSALDRIDGKLDRIIERGGK